MARREVLIDSGTSGVLREFDYPVYVGDFGDGWYAAALVGTGQAARTWTLTWAGIYHDAYRRPFLLTPRWDDGEIVAPITGEPERPQSRLIYLQWFFARRIAEGFTPFWLIDPGEIDDPRYPTMQMVRFKTDSLKFQQDTTDNRRWSMSVQVVNARMPAENNRSQLMFNPYA